jgi:hypothetical protein
MIASSNVSVLGHGAATFRMWRSDYVNPRLYNHSEGRHGIAVYGSRNVLLDGLTVTETGGDGVYISNILGKLGTPNRNITVRNCNLTGNYRNAMSVISVSGLNVQNTILALSKGTPPEGHVLLFFNLTLFVGQAHCSAQPHQQTYPHCTGACLTCTDPIPVTPLHWRVPDLHGPNPCNPIALARA